MTEEAVRERSSILQLERLKCPVLILHGFDASSRRLRLLGNMAKSTRDSGQRIEHDDRLISAGNHRFGDGDQLILLAENA
jgi:hypothetical protein